MVSAVGRSAAAPKTCTGMAKQAQNKLCHLILNKENPDSSSKLFLLYEFLRYETHLHL